MLRFRGAAIRWNRPLLSRVFGDNSARESATRSSLGTFFVQDQSIYIATPMITIVAESLIDVLGKKLRLLELMLA